LDETASKTPLIYVALLVVYLGAVEFEMKRLDLTLFDPLVW
jgi:hypothetical protein